MLIENKEQEGNVAYWPLSTTKEKFTYTRNQKKYNDLEGTLRPVIQYLLPREIEELTYVQKHNLMCFLEKGKNNKVFFQYFPYTENNNKRDIQENIKIYKKKLEDSEFESTLFLNEEIFSLTSTRSHLFSLVRSNGVLYIQKYILKDQKYHYYQRKELKVDITDLENNDLQLSVFEFSENETIIFLLVKSKKKLLFSSFKEFSTRKDYIFLKDFNEILTSVSIAPKALTVTKKNEGIILSITEDTDEGYDSISVFKQKKNKFSFSKLDEIKSIKEKDLLINSYNIKAKHLYLTPGDHVFSFFIICSKNKIYAYDIENRNTKIILGDGTEDFQQKVIRGDKNLKKTFFHSLNFMKPINDIGLVFGNTSISNIFMLICPKFKDFFETSSHSKHDANDFFDFDYS